MGESPADIFKHGFAEFRTFVNPLIAAALRGFFAFVCGHDWRVLRLQPRFDIPDAKLDELARACREELDHLASLSWSGRARYCACARPGVHGTR